MEHRGQDVDALEAFFRLGQIAEHPIQDPDKSIVNLSSTFILSDEQKQLLKKGLSFIPTPELSGLGQIFKTQLSAYHRRLKLNFYFEESTTPVELRPHFHLKSNWEPEADLLPDELNKLIKTDDRTLPKIKPIQNKQNLSQTEREALEGLQHCTSIVLKPADKGSAVVLMDREKYIKEAMRQLNDVAYYKPLVEPIYLESIPLISNILDRLVKKGHITTKQKSYLLPSGKIRKRLFYLLPKIHKSRDQWPLGDIPPGRPIVSDCGSESYHIAEFLDFHLNPLSNRHRSYIKDTYDFLEKVKALNLKDPCLLFSLDVDALYTNIDHERGIEAIKWIFEKYPEYGRPTKEIIELLHLSLSRNDFEFNGQHFLQIKGTAMGKKFAPAYANIYMAMWEETILPVCTKQPLCFYRFLDDIWGVWTHSKDDFSDFMDKLNSHHDSIKLKSTVANLSIDFLDVTVFKGVDFVHTGKLDTKVFFKPTDSHSLLYKTSFHPKHTFKGIVKSQLIRFNRICSRWEDRTEATSILFKALRPRGYSRSFLRSIEKEVYGNNSFQRVGPIQDEEERLIPFVVDYSLTAKAAVWQAKHNYNRFMSNHPLYQQTRILSAFKRNPNLQDLLVRAKLPRPGRKIKTKFDTRVVRNVRNGSTWPIQQYITLDFSNCVYLIKCRRCNMLYVGETKNSLKARRSNHVYNIKTGRKAGTLLVEHFIKHGVSNLVMVGLEHNPSWDYKKRRSAERKWIYWLGTKTPQGLNQT